MVIDYLVGAAKQREREREAECLDGLEIDHKLSFRDLLDRKVCGLSALEDFARIDPTPAKRIGKLCLVAVE
jgi:hypothetical protein